MSNKLRKLLIICDFDGTVSTVDLGNEFLNEFSIKDLSAINRAYARQEMGSRIAYGKIAGLLKGSRKKMLNFILAREKIDPYFLKFYQLSKKKGLDVKIVSDGLDFYIEAFLEKHQLKEIEFFSNQAVFNGDQSISIEFPEANLLCGSCGTCKNSILNSYRLLYEKIIYIGDSYSDFCPARYADLVFAKKILFDRCTRDGIPCIYFTDFREINAYLKANY